MESSDLSIPLRAYLSLTSTPSAILPVPLPADLNGDQRIYTNAPWSDLNSNEGLFHFLNEVERVTVAKELHEMIASGEEGEVVLGKESKRREFRATWLKDYGVVVLTTEALSIYIPPTPQPPPPFLKQRPSLTKVPTLKSLMTTSPPTTPLAGKTERELAEETAKYMDCISGLGEMGKMVVEFPWETTPLGPISSWSPLLRSSVSSCLSSPLRHCLIWGPTSTIIYNDMYIKTALTKHPWLLGKPIKVAWSEAWESMKGMVQESWDGTTRYTESQHLPLYRNGILEESYHTYAFTPIRDESGVVLGLSNYSFETTPEVLSKRRMNTVNDLVQRTARTRSLTEFCQNALDALSQNPYDLPFVQIYTTSTLSSGGGEGGMKKQNTVVGGDTKIDIKLTLQGSIGIPEDHVLQQPSISFALDPSSSTTSYQPAPSSPTSTFRWPFQLACLEREPVIVSDCADVLKDLEGRAWGDNPDKAVVIPVFTEGDGVVPMAVLIFGSNPRSVLTDLYMAFTSVISRNTAIGLLSVTNAEADIRRAEELLALDQSKSKFFSNTSHELRTPLTLILSPVEDILQSKEEILSKDVRRQLEVVAKNGQRLLSMVNKLLDFSAIEGGRMQLRFEPVNLGQLTTDLSSLFRNAIQSAGLSFEVASQGDGEGWAPVYMSRDLYTHILNNLLSNALKYTQRGAIKLALRSTEEEAVLSVEDSGLGIPSEQLASIFERFHRVEATAHSASGTGIGLALTLEIVKMLGGTLSVESNVGKGSTFTATFKRGFAHLPSEQVVHQAAQADEGQSKMLARNFRTELNQATYYRDEAYKVRRPTLSTKASSDSARTSETIPSSVASGSDASSLDVLEVAGSVVLYSPDLRSYIGNLLRQLYKVVEVSDGQQALQYALKSPPALVITDVSMPRLTGDELFAALRANPKTSHIPVICLSAQAGAEARTQALERGVDDYLVKPFQSRELLARTKLHLQLGKMRKALELRVQERTIALNESESRYRSLAERQTAITNSVPTGIFLMDATPNIVFTNGRWHEITGHPESRPLTEWQEAVHPDYLDRLIHISIAIAEKRVASGSIQFMYKNGTWVQLEFRSVSEFEDDVAFVGTVTDITHEKRIEALHMEEVEQRASDAEAHRQHIENFIDIASHEIRILSPEFNSMRKLLSMIEELQEDRRSQREVLAEFHEELAEDLEGVQAILICAAHQRRIADDILNVSKLNMGLLTVNRLSFNLPDKISEVVKMFQVECQSEDISLHLAVANSVEDLDAVWIVADPNRLAQACVNFILNGIKFTTGPGSILVSITASLEVPPMMPTAFRVGDVTLQDMSLYSSPVWVTVSITDSGKGINDEEMVKLFDRFSQVNPKTDQYGGSGLGLYVSKKLLELHHGFIEVVSVPGQGSTFQFKVPAERGTPNAFRRPSLTTYGSSQNTIVDIMGQRRPRKLSNSAVSRPRSPAIADRQKHILVVEDNVINQKVLKRQLNLAGFRVSLANHGREALDFIYPKSGLQDEEYIDCILMDIEMPVLGGLDTIKALRERENAQPVPSRYGVIAVTGNARQEQRELYLNAGFTDVAIKPYAIGKLMEQIQAVLASR